MVFPLWNTEYQRNCAASIFKEFHSVYNCGKNLELFFVGQASSLSMPPETGRMPIPRYFDGPM